MDDWGRFLLEISFLFLCGNLSSFDFILRGMNSEGHGGAFTGNDLVI
jgi:hypothetical protein